MHSLELTLRQKKMEQVLAARCGEGYVLVPGCYFVSSVAHIIYYSGNFLKLLLPFHLIFLHPAHPVRSCGSYAHLSWQQANQ